MFYNIVLVSAIQQYNSAIILCIYIYITSSWVSLPSSSIPEVITECSAGLPELHSNFSPAIYFTHGSVYMSVLFSPLIPFFSYDTKAWSIKEKKIDKLNESTDCKKIFANCVSENGLIFRIYGEFSELNSQNENKPFSCKMDKQHEKHLPKMWWQMNIWKDIHHHQGGEN